MQSNKTCTILEEYLSYLQVIKKRSICTTNEYRTDILMFFKWLSDMRGTLNSNNDFSFINSYYLKSITKYEMYSFITYCQNNLHSCTGTRARKIVSIRQFWKYLKKHDVIDTNPAEDLETPKISKRILHYLSLEESVRLLISCKDSACDHCIITLLLNCALRISELASLNVFHASYEVLHIIRKGNKERKIFLTPAAKNSLALWLTHRKQLESNSSSLFVSKNLTGMSVKSLQDVVKKYVLLSGLDPKLVSAHTLRHTSATLMYKYGQIDLRSLQQILGHESVATTEIYTHIDESQLQAAVNSNPLAIMFS